MKYSHIRKHRLTHLRLVKKKTLHIGNGEVVYRLWRKRAGAVGYFAQINYGADMATAFLGEDEGRAAVVFGRLCRGLVTPCALADIVKDLAAEY